MRESFRLPAYLLTGALLISMTIAGVSRSATPPPEDSRSPAGTPQAAAAERERWFADLLSGAVLEGTWRMTSFAAGQEPSLGEPRSDRYTIEKAEKIIDDQWMVTARVQYGDKDVSLPIPVRVLWAGDTPVITLDTLNMPMLGTYSARVMFHNDLYAGVWYGATYGGVMSGRIVKTASAGNAQAESAPPTP